MLSLLKTYTGGEIMVGNNGYVWISDQSNIPLLLKAIKLIELKAHKSGLTDTIAQMLKDETGLELEVSQIEGENYEQQY
jgi:exosome complex RNA-binding protein Rrp4